MDWTFSGVDSNLLMTVVMGAICGYTASRLLGGEGFGCLGNIVIGVAGGYIGSWLAGYFTIRMMSGFFGSLVASVIGAVLLILLVEVTKYFILRNKSLKPTRRRR
jgi:uncharacterized membrane protein YeaQ/YmgE (transglycosylase-associated protein family)